MGFLGQNMGNGPTSQLYIEIFWDKRGYLGQNMGNGPTSPLYIYYPVIRQVNPEVTG